jgi:hypothetical protein
MYEVWMLFAMVVAPLVSPGIPWPFPTTSKQLSRNTSFQGQNAHMEVGLHQIHLETSTDQILATPIKKRIISTKAINHTRLYPDDILKLPELSLARAEHTRTCKMWRHKSRVTISKPPTESLLDGLINSTASTDDLDISFVPSRIEPKSSPPPSSDVEDDDTESDEEFQIKLTE